MEEIYLQNANMSLHNYLSDKIPIVVYQQIESNLTFKFPFKQDFKQIPILY